MTVRDPTESHVKRRRAHRSLGVPVGKYLGVRIDEHLDSAKRIETITDEAELVSGRSLYPTLDRGSPLSLENKCLVYSYR